MMPIHSSSARVDTKDYYLSKLEGNRSDNEIVVLITVKEAGISSLRYLLETVGGGCRYLKS